MARLHDKLMNKNGLTAMELAQLLLCYEIGERLPTITELSEQLNTSRGTLQNSLKLLSDCGAVMLSPRGHLGTILADVDYEKLMDLADIQSMVGVMPLPYSKKYEGFATGLVKCFDNSPFGLALNLAFMRGARKRVDMLAERRYDFAVVSKLAAKCCIEINSDIEITMEFGAGSYLGRHVAVFRDDLPSLIENGLRVGLDNDSYDQVQLTRRFCDGFDVKYVPVSYNQVLEKLKSREIDMAVWNIDEITDKAIPVKYALLDTDNDDDTTAVIVTDKRKPEIKSLLKKTIRTSDVLDIQKLVERRDCIPNY